MPKVKKREQDLTKCNYSECLGIFFSLQFDLIQLKCKEIYSMNQRKPCNSSVWEEADASPPSELYIGINGMITQTTFILPGMSDSQI